MFWKRRKREKALNIGLNNFTATIEQNSIVFIFFKAPWCGACKILSPLVDELADENRDRDIVIGYVHVDYEPELSQRFQIRSLPTLIVFQEGDIAYTGSGMISKPRLQEMVDNSISKK